MAERLARIRGWGALGIRLGIRAEFRCEYCGRDLLASVDDYKAWAQDHLIPANPKSSGPSTFENLVIACHPCNSYKGDWDPRSTAGEFASRDGLLRAARAVIMARRSADQAALDQTRAVVGWVPRAGVLAANPTSDIT